MRKDVQVSLQEEDIQTIYSVVNEIKRGTLLNFPKPGIPYILYTDASDYSIGSILIQDSKLIGLYSYKIKCSELNYTVAEKETYVILKSLKYFNTIVFGESITCYTDNKNSLNDVEITKILNRWKLLLSEYM